jgi:putative ATP-dependent endonuclease of OLD family
MTVLLEKVVVRNFRSLSFAELPLSAYTPLVGYNNSGKTNAVSAIQWLLRKSSLSAQDFYDEATPVHVEAEISGVTQAVINVLPERQRGQVTPHVVGDKLRVKRTQVAPSARATDIQLSVWDPRVNDWTPNPVGLDNALGVILPEPIRIGAMEDAAEDSSKAKTSTTIGKLLGEFVAPVRAAHQAELQRILFDLERRLSAAGDTRFAELGIIENAITAKINDLFPGIEARLHFPTPAIDDLIKSGTLKLAEGAGVPRDFSSYGHGTQRSVQMALIRHLADVRRGDAANPGTTLLLIDEPELYLHPFAVEQVRVALKTLSANGYQVIFSTHSAQLVPAMDAQFALLIRKNDQGATTPRRRLRDAIQTVVPDSVHQMEQLFTLSHSSQVLFADRAVLAEGKTEQRLLPNLYAAVRGRSLGQERTALVAQSGVNDTKKSLEILAAMDLPAKAIVDLDYVLNGAIAHGFVCRTDPDVVALLAIVARLAAAGQIAVNPAGLPQRGPVSAHEAFVLLAGEADAQAPIAALHVKLLRQQIWMWQKGAIENHLGLSGKNEREWAKFQTAIETLRLDEVCPDPAETQALVNWLAA